MKRYTTDQLALMPVDKALGKHFDSANYGVLRWLWVFALGTYFGFFIEASVDGRVNDLLLMAVGLAVLFVMRLSRQQEFYEENFKYIFTGFLILAPFGILAVANDDEFRFILPMAILPMALVFARLVPSHLFLTAGSYIAAAFLARVGNELADAESIAPAIVTSAIFGTTGLIITWRRKKAFIEDWTQVSRRERERERMREELADARKIQLAMLPSAPPDIDWLDISSVSVPATEVGGDFYEYFELDENRVVIAIGDVAGHGVGSGLVLAGMKSGLHLLREELSTPVVAIERLNRLASEWLQWRMLVTLMLAVVDRSALTVRVVCAGHPPLMVARGDEITQIGGPALPLGTKLEPMFSEHVHYLKSGDTLLAYTDGVTELQNGSNDMYGEDRLSAAFGKFAAKSESARQIRDPLLEDISHFKDNAPQLDDLSFVVARVGEVG